MVETRSKNGFNFGIVIIPEGLLKSIPEMIVLISEDNDHSQYMNMKNQQILINKEIL